jgi:hypothetical protein
VPFHFLEDVGTLLAQSSSDGPASINGIDTLGPQHADSHSVKRIHTMHAYVEAQIDIYHNKTQKQWWAET